MAGAGNLRFLRLVPAALLFLLILTSPAAAKTIIADTEWSGSVLVEEDLRVAPGATLTIAAGTKVLFAEAVSTKTDPSFFSPQTEITVEGKLVAAGTPDAPVTFEPQTGYWGGIIAAPKGEVILRNAVLARAEEALLVDGGTLRAQKTVVRGSDFGLVLAPERIFEGDGLSLESCKVGVVDMAGKADSIAGVTVKDAEDAAFLSFAYTRETPETPVLPEPKGPEREFVGDYTVEGKESWRGVVTISGRVTVPPGSVLNIEPGTRVRFRKKDTDGDNLGEGELLVTGSIRAVGLKENPIVFESAERSPSPGDWDKVSVISSEDPENVFENTLFRYGVQGLHGHFSNLTVRDSTFVSNIRAVQFQESERTTVTGSTFIGNKQAVRFRDSAVTIENCFFSGNDYSVHAFRGSLDFRGNRVIGSKLGGMLAKECSLKVENNLFDLGRNSLKVKGEGAFLTLRANKLLRNTESALSLSYAEGEITGNEFDLAGLDLVGVEEGKVAFRDNVFGLAKRHSIHLSGSKGIDAAQNWWNPENPPEKSIYDGKDDPSLGLVTFEPAKEWATRPH
ncbi:right-handed parallel beta-helix repeat-containing protein [bacterium]|nr:MAG: right-handed parallel beta-helix repeat-containing protein [bacterium]